MQVQTARLVHGEDGDQPPPIPSSGRVSGETFASQATGSTDIVQDDLELKSLDSFGLENSHQEGNVVTRSADLQTIVCKVDK